MQETWTFDYSSRLNSEALSDFLKNKVKGMESFLSYYYKKEGAVADKSRIKGDPTFTETKSGKL